MERAESFVTKPSGRSFEETVDALAGALEAAGNTIFGHLDQAAEAARVGASLRPTVVLTFGNPRAGTRLMEALPSLALDLPLRAVVWEDESSGVTVAFNRMRVLAARHGDVAGLAAVLDTLDARVAALVDEALRPAASAGPG